MATGPYLSSSLNDMTTRNLLLAFFLIPPSPTRPPSLSQSNSSTLLITYLLFSYFSSNYTFMFACPYSTLSVLYVLEESILYIKFQNALRLASTQIVVTQQIVFQHDDLNTSDNANENFYMKMKNTKVTFRINL